MTLKKVRRWGVSHYSVVLGMFGGWTAMVWMCELWRWVWVGVSVLMPGGVGLGGYAHA